VRTAIRNRPVGSGSPTTRPSVCLKKPSTPPTTASTVTPRADLVPLRLAGPVRLAAALRDDTLDARSAVIDQPLLSPLPDQPTRASAQGREVADGREALQGMPCARRTAQAEVRTSDLKQVEDDVGRRHREARRLAREAAG
jgi:hypothetical protein